MITFTKVIGLLLSACALSLFAQTVAAPMPVANQQFLDCRNGTCLPLNGGMLYSFAAGTTTPLNTYTSSAGTTPNSNPVVLNSSGFNAAGSGSAGVWIINQCYKFELQDSQGVDLWIQDNVCNQEALMLATLAGTGGAGLIGFEPTSGTVPMTVSSALNTFTLDAGFATYAAACAAATGAGKTLLVTKLWAVPTGTYACSAMFLATGKLRVNLNSTAAFTAEMICPTYQQCFDTTTNSNAHMTATKRDSNFGPVQFGADFTGASDSLAAFNAAYSASNNLYLPLGIYTLTGEFSMTAPGSSFLCEGTKPGAGVTNKDTIIQYTGSSLIRSVFRVTAGGSGDDRVENCYIRGNTHSTYALFLDAPNGSVFRNLRVDGGLTAAVFHSVGVANLIDHIAIQTRAPNTTAVGLWVDSSNTLTVISPNIDGFRVATSGFDGIGIKSTSSAVIHVIGGTSEGNYINVQNGANSSLDLYSMDNEAATLYGLDDSGTSVITSGLHGGTMHYSATAIGSALRNTNTDQITIDAGATGIIIEGNTYGSTFGTLTNNGTCTYLIRNRAAVAGHSYTADLFGCGGLDFAGGINYIYETAGLDNAIVGTYTPARSDGTRISANYPTLPLKDGMEFNIKLATHALQAGVNTFDFLDGSGPHVIRKASNPSQNLGTAYGVGASIKLRYDADGGLYVDLRQ